MRLRSSEVVNLASLDAYVGAIHKILECLANYVHEGLEINDPRAAYRLRIIDRISKVRNELNSLQKAFRNKEN